MLRTFSEFSRWTWEARTLVRYKKYLNLVMFDCYCVTCYLLKCVVGGELLEDKQLLKFEDVITVCHCVYLVKESEQNKWKISQNEEEWPKDEGKIAKCENCELSKNLSEKRAKKDAASKIITCSIAHTKGLKSSITHAMQVITHAIVTITVTSCR